MYANESGNKTYEQQKYLISKENQKMPGNEF